VRTGSQYQRFLGAVIEPRKGEFMIRQMKSRLLAIMLPALLMGLALPGLAGADVRSNVGAIEYDGVFTVVSVLAVSHPVQDPAAWHFESLVLTHPDGSTNDLDVTHAEVHVFPLLGAKLWVVKFGEGLIDHTSLTTGSDTLSAVVDVLGTLEEDTATCGPGLRRTHITAICK
jgi:hypothetical protein